MRLDRAASQRSAIAWLAIAIVSLLGLAALTVVSAGQALLPFDRPLLATAVTWGSAWKPVWEFFSFVGNLPMIPTAIAFVLWLIYKRRHREAVLVIVLFALATAGQEGLKALVARPRPLGSAPGIPGSVYSYPSGHALEDLVILGMLAVNVWRRSPIAWLRLAVAALVVFEVVMVCLARVALDLHYPSDDLAGLLGGFAILGLYAWWTRPGAWADRPPLRTSSA
ncbi:MAG TPA: phosphatase PAP2 family protein [Candidatus Binatus sp.]|nr:phosphatase PAP2 family protein [Candidatus Binatus sp.]